MPNVSCPEGPLRVVRDHSVLPRHLEGKTRGQQWYVKSGAWGGPAAAAWYKVLEVPDAVSGKDEWKIGVSYWSVRGTPNNIRYGRQWLWVYRRQSSCVMAAAKDYFFVKLREMHVPWRARGDFGDSCGLECPWGSAPGAAGEAAGQRPQAGLTDRPLS